MIITTLADYLHFSLYKVSLHALIFNVHKNYVVNRTAIISLILEIRKTKLNGV